MTYSEFIAGYPEFASATQALIERKIADATARTALDYPADVREIRIGLKAAQLLALSPYGRDMQMLSTDGSTVYDTELTAMDRAAAAGVGRVA